MRYAADGIIVRPQSALSLNNELPQKPLPHANLQVMSPVEIERHTTYEGPTWLDEAIVSKWRPSQPRPMVGWPRVGSWLAARDLAEVPPVGDIAPRPDKQGEPAKG